MLAEPTQGIADFEILKPVGIRGVAKEGYRFFVVLLWVIEGLKLARWDVLWGFFLRRCKWLLWAKSISINVVVFICKYVGSFASL